MLRIGKWRWDALTDLIPATMCSFAVTVIAPGLPWWRTFVATLLFFMAFDSNDWLIVRRGVGPLRPRDFGRGR